MKNKSLSLEQKRVDHDLMMIIIVTFIVLGIYTGYNEPFDAFAKNENLPLLLRTAVLAFFQFGVAGLGITMVSIYRKESFVQFGLNRKNLMKAILLSIITFVPYSIFSIVTGETTSYMPFQSVLFTKDVLSSPLPINVIGMLIIALAWGFFEGFNYVVIADKINIRFPSSHFWLDWGAITCAVMCILIHGVIGITPSDIIEMMTVLFIIYGMLMVRKMTGNAWGCVFIFVFLWNAF
jgi:hypothetical protein